MNDGEMSGRQNSLQSETGNEFPHQSKQCREESMKRSRKREEKRTRRGQGGGECVPQAAVSGVNANA